MTAPAESPSHVLAVVLHATGSDGKKYEVALDKDTGNILSQLAVVPTITIANVSLDAASTSTGIPSTARLLSAAGTTNDTNVKNAAGRVYAIHGYNAANAARYLKLYNKATTPSVGTDTPVKTLYLAATSTFSFSWDVGRSFATGIGYGLTTAAADNSTAAVTAGDILALNIDYA